MPFSYSIYYYLKCDISSCQQETPQRLDGAVVMEEGESKGWVTPDGLRWYCPTHVSSPEASDLSQG